MVKARYIYRLSDGVFIGGGFCEVQPPDDRHGVHEFDDADQPDLLLDRYDPVLGKRRATDEELAAVKALVEVEQASTTSQDKTLLATVAFVIRQKEPAAWAALSPAKKKAAVLAGAEAWRDLRVLVDQLTRDDAGAPPRGRTN